MARSTRAPLPAPYTLDGYRSDVDIDWSTVDLLPPACVARGIAALRSRGWWTRQHVQLAIDALTPGQALGGLPHYQVAVWLGMRFAADSEEWLEAHGFLEAWALTRDRGRVPASRYELDQRWHIAFRGLSDE